MNKDDIVSIQNLLNGAFVWEDTEQGHDYWSNVDKNLEKLLKTNKEVM